MSLVYITHHTENVRDYENIEVSHVPTRQSTKYVSQHKKHVIKQIHQPYITDAPEGLKLITDWGKHERRTMGCANTPLDPPSRFLRKNEGIKWRRLHDHVCPKPLGLAPVPRVSQMEPLKICESKKKSVEKPEIVRLSDRTGRSHQNKIQQKQDRLCHRKNFIAINRKRAIHMKTKRPPPKFVDTPFGDRQNLLNSGLIPQFVCGKNFAKIPCYIDAHKKLLRKYQEACAKEHKIMDGCDKYMDQHGVRRMSIEERLAIIEGLKVNYLEVLKTFQTLSLYTDTPTKKLRKSRLEKELVQLESDIHFLQDNPVIYISDY